MKLRRFLFAFLISLAAVQFCFSQGNEQKLALLNSFTKPTCEELLANLEGFTSLINNESNSVGYIVIYGGINSFENNFYERYLNQRLKLWKVNANRLTVITAKGGNELKIEFWTSKNGERPKISEENFRYDLPQTNRRYLFVEASGEIVNSGGENDFAEDCSACCVETFDLDLLSKFLKSNPKFNAHIFVYNKSTLKRAAKFIKVISDAAVTDYKIPRQRLKITYGGKKEGIYVWNKNMASLWVWLVPNSAKKTKLLSNKK